jgi:2-polyprenyl-6-methoxyphenol hydroxylase-like FAD-dependent oxidoreductase
MVRMSCCLRQSDTKREHSGAGIGGLTLALALSQYPDIEVELYDAAATLAEVGAGIGIFPRPWKIIQMLGLEDDLLETTERKPVQGLGTCFGALEILNLHRT